MTNNEQFVQTILNVSAVMVNSSYTKAVCQKCPHLDTLDRRPSRKSVVQNGFLSETSGYETILG